MNVYLKSAVQNLDAHIAQMTEIRDRLVGSELSGGTPDARGTPEPVQTIGRPYPYPQPLKDLAAEFGRFKKQRTKQLRKQKRGGRRVRTENGEPKPEVGAGSAPLSAMSAGMLSAGHNAVEPFGIRELQAATGCTVKQASNAVTRWLLKKLVKRVGKGQYRRLAKFPETSLTQGARAVPAPEPTRQTSVTIAAVSKPPVVKAKSAAPGATAENGALPQQRPTESDEKLTPYSSKGIAVGQQLKPTFSMDELAALLPQGKQAAYYFVSQWRARNWIRKEDFDVYHKEPNFGQ